ncbi:MAG TPA: trigger factor [Acidimicrobiia bacterium]|jgi:trigger factor|nr:trigger factor [Acidimicrobiia bacterium]
MQSTVESVEGNKVKLHVTVPADEFERAIDAAFRKLARDVRVPGFRPGKAPRRLLEARLGTDVGREQALRDSLPEFYVDAVTEHDVDVIAPPEIEVTAGQNEGDVEFEAVVEVRPQVHLTGYDELRVELPVGPVRDQDVDDQVDRLRDRFADLTDSDLPLIDDAYATIDIAGSIDGKPVEGLTATDFLYRVGSDMVVPELDQQLRGTRPGAILEFTAELPERFGDRAGEQATFRIIVKEAKRKVLPELTDEWVDEASEFDTVSELRDDLRRRLETIQRLQARRATRDKVLEAVADLVPIPAPEALVDSETRRRVEDLAHRLSHENATLEEYLQAIDQEPQAFLDGVREGSARAVLADLALRAVVTQEAISVSEDEIGAEVERIALQLEQKVEKVRRDLERRGVLETVRSDVARGKALEFLIDHATVVDEEGNEIDITIPDGQPSSDGEDENESSADESTEDESTKERPEA